LYTLHLTGVLFELLSPSACGTSCMGSACYGPFAAVRRPGDGSLTPVAATHDQPEGCDHSFTADGPDGGHPKLP
jgi:hypothetical protein